MPKYTPWFSGDVKPVRPGVYETDSKGSPFRCFQFWDGVKWGLASITPAIAHACAGTTSLCQDDAWRGLTKEAKHA